MSIAPTFLDESGKPWDRDPDPAMLYCRVPDGFLVTVTTDKGADFRGRARHRNGYQSRNMVLADGSNITLPFSIVAGFEFHPCPMCGDLGYLLSAHHAGSPRPPLTIDLAACFYPECNLKEPPEIASLQVLGMFTDVVPHPSDGTIMALTGFTGPVFR